MVKYRNRLNIIADILRVVEKPGKKTHIMYSANLSYRLTQKYLEEILDAGLIRFNNNDAYELTEKGFMFLEKYKEYHSEYSKAQMTLQELKAQRRELKRMCQECADDADCKSTVERKTSNG